MWQQEFLWFFTIFHRNYSGPKKLHNRVHAVYAPSHEFSRAYR